MFDNLFGKLNSGSNEFVGVSLNDSGLLEVIQTSRTNQQVLKYTNRVIDYDPINRVISDYNELNVALEESLKELGIPVKGCNIVFSLPNVLFGVETYQSGSSPEQYLLSIIEDSFRFSRVEPVISWKVIEDSNGVQKIAYSAIQENTVKQLQAICAELDINLISIQNSFSAIIGGLTFSEKLESMLQDGSLNILLVSQTSYSIFNFVNSKLDEYREEPLAVKSFSGEEVYTAVCSAALRAFESMPASKVLVISETSDVSAELVMKKLNISAEDGYIEQSANYQEKAVIDVSLDVLQKYRNHITLAAIGASVDYSEGNPIKLNYLSTSEFKGTEVPDLITIGGKSYEITVPLVQKIAGVIVAIFLVIWGGLYFGVQTLSNSVNEELNTLNENERKVEEQLKSFKDVKPKTVDISQSIEKVVESNRKKMLYYDALSYGIPEKLWIERFYVGTGGVVGINGASVESSDIAAFLKGIREVAGETEVSVTKLDVIGGDDILNANEPEVYSFQLANQAYISSSQAQTPVSGQAPNNKAKIPAAGAQSKVPPVIPVN